MNKEQKEKILGLAKKLEKSDEFEEIKTYTFKDLILPENKDVLEKVLQKEYDINVDYEWYDSIIEDWENKLEDYGFENPTIEFSGFWSQGDGASFTSSINFDIVAENNTGLEFKEARQAWHEDLLEASVVRITHHYSHENTCKIDWYLNEDEDIFVNEELIEEAMDTLEKQRVDFCKEIYRDLEKEYEYLTSEDSILETIEANNYLFDEDGNIV